MMIETIRILGLDYAIELTDRRTGLGNAGQILNTQALIQLDKEVNSPEHLKSVLLHEVIEALKYRLELNLDHNIIVSLESGLFQVLTDNPEFVKLFLEDS